MRNIKYEYYKCANNVKLCLIPLNITTVNIGIFVPIGASIENENEIGLAHFLEHMLFTNTEKYCEEKINDLVDLYGGNINASTSYDTTLYKIMGNSKFVIEYLDILCEIYFKPRFTDNKIEREKLVVYEEIKQRSMNPGYESDKLAMKLLYDNRYSENIGGTKTSVSKFDKYILKSFKEKYYKLEESYIIIAGNYKKADIFNYCEKQFGEISSFQPNYQKLKKKIEIEYPNKLPLFKIIKTKLDQKIVNFYFKAVGDDSEWKYHFFILDNILTGSLGSLLNNKLRNQLGATYGVSSDLIRFRNSGFYNIHFKCHSDKVIECIKETIIILKECMKNTLINKSHLERARNQVETSLLMTFDNPLKYYYILINGLSNNIEPITKESIMRCIERITVESLVSLCNILFNPKNMILIVEGWNDNDTKNNLESKLDDVFLQIK